MTLAKVLVFLALAPTVVRPFVGFNAEEHYLPAAQRLVVEGRFNGADSRPDSKVPPGYPAVVATAMLAAPRQFLSMTVAFQLVADLATAIAVYRIGSQFASGMTALTAGVMWLAFPPAVVISTWITAETCFIALLTAGTAVLLYGLHSRQVAAILAAGLLTGLATYFRGTSLLLPLVYAPVLFTKRRFRDALVFTLATYCVVAPWTIRNYRVLGDPIVVSVGVGGAFLQGSDARYFRGEGKATEYPTMFQQAAAEGLPKPASDKESEIDGWLQAIGQRHYQVRLRDDPLSFFPFAARKFVRLWYGTEAAGWKSQAILALCSVLLVPIGTWQWWRWRKVSPLEVDVLTSQFCYFVILHTVTLPEFRYMLPLFPLFMIGAAGFLGGVWHRSRRFPQNLFRELTESSPNVGA